MVNVGSVSAHRSSNHSHSRQDHGDSEFNDPANWDSASYTADPIDAIEPLEVVVNCYREKALDCRAVLRAVDNFVAHARDPRLAWVGVSLGLGLCSTQGMSPAELSRQMGCTELALTRATQRFLKLSGLDSSSGNLAPSLWTQSAKRRPDFGCCF